MWDVVALLAGPLVLMPVGHRSPSPVDRSALLAAEPALHDPHTWNAGALRLKSFLDIKEEPYTTYSRVSSRA